MNLHIVYEDDHIIVCYKPAGIATQTAKIGEQDMVSILKNYLYKKQTDKREAYIAVIHRLDQPVEGLLVFAKTPFAAKELSKGLQGVSFGKHYKAVLCGAPENSNGILKDYLIKDGRTNTSRVADPSEKDAKKAVLFYETLAIGVDDGKQISMVSVTLDTGRHHQIRVQMANMGCPIWGDAKYNTAVVQDRRFRHIALCAYKLVFEHPKTKQKMEFEVEPQGEAFKLFVLDKPGDFQ